MIAARSSRALRRTIGRRESVGASWINGKGPSIIRVKVAPRRTVAPRSPQRASERVPRFFFFDPQRECVSSSIRDVFRAIVGLKRSRSERGATLRSILHDYR